MLCLPEQWQALKCTLIAVCVSISAVYAKDRSSPSPGISRTDQARSKAQCDPKSFKLVIDVGHTKSSPGATSARGETEYVFNLKLGKQIQETLVAAGFSETYLLVTDAPQRSQLNARSARANAIKPDLFLSVHHDDVQPRYYEKWNFQGIQRSFSDKFSGYSIFVSSGNKHINSSVRFAKSLGAELLDRGLHYSAHHTEDIPGERRQLVDTHAGVYRYDQLHVLRSVNAPSVLFEAGIITNRQEELVLDTDERRQAVSNSVLAAINAFCR